jgi:hypothetical protein
VQAGGGAVELRAQAARPRLASAPESPSTLSAKPTDNNVGIAIAIDVARPTHRGAEEFTCGDASQLKAIATIQRRKV